MSERPSKILIQGGRIIDPAHGRDGIGDLLIENGVIRENFPPAEKGESNGSENAKREMHRIDAKGMIVVPGLIDLHTHIREPGFEYKETVATATAAAAAGGFTTICCMPNTNPVNDNQSVTELILEKARTEGVVHVLPIGAITKGSRGEELAEMGELVTAGCVAISDDGLPVMNSEVMRRAMEYAKIFDVPIIDHCEDLNLTGDGVIFEGSVSTSLGLKGIPAASETVMVARDIALAELTGGRIHLAHISTAGSVRLIREAKRRGIPVTAETCPHYLVLTDERVMGFDANAKMKPPLATGQDLEEVRAGLADGTIDAIATDHAPHAPDEKNREIDHAPFGIIGLETALSISLSLVEEGILSLPDLIGKMTVQPARILGKKMGQLGPGDIADVTIIDPNVEWHVSVSDIKSKSKNSPFLGWNMKGRARTVIVAGKIIENKWT
ncbi:MAG: dihydroorotase [Nitrospira sp.]|nr:dihydroorotase [Candidatus Manganitrophaceae bacterium]HIL34626.1 dihydroorotase [Candidatus Manganitrophaceae bacterium]